MKTHELKTLPCHFGPVHDGLKLAELRVNDRGYAVGDTLELREWQPDGYTGASLQALVIHVADVGHLLPGYVLLSFELFTTH